MIIHFPIPKIKRRKRKLPLPGAEPGVLIPPTELPKPIVYRIDYNSTRFDSTKLEIDSLTAATFPQPDVITWLDVQGLGDIEFLKRIGDQLELHPLTLEDIVHIHQRPKVEEYDDYLFVVLRAVRLLDENRIDNEQLSFVLKDRILATFQERPGDGFNPVRKRLQDGKSMLRKNSADYLLYALLDATIDNYFPALEAYADTMDLLDERLRENPHPNLSRAVHAMRRELRQFRRAAWPLRDLTGALGRSDFTLVTDQTKLALRDCHDHAVQVADFVESGRERASDLADLYLAMVSEKTNQTMRTLTIIATIFIPLTFLCGLYGMNFDPDASPFNMPELKWKYGYPAFWITMILIFLLMLWFFHRKGWIGNKNKKY